MMNLFSIFDPSSSFLSLNMPFNWVAAITGMIILPSTYWMMHSQSVKSVNQLFLSLLAEISAVLGMLSPPGSLLIFVSLFFFILFSNFLGLFPYVFTSSSHLSFTMSLAIPLWFGCIIWAWLFQINNMFSHLVPVGTPLLLMPLMVLIESVSNLIRPGALAVRLAANMVAGHLLLSLLGGSSQSVTSVMLLMAMLSLILLMILESAVACIQAYVFTILNSLYLEELMNLSFNKKMVS